MTDLPPVADAPAHKDTGSLRDLIETGFSPSRRWAIGLMGASAASSVLASCGGGGAGSGSGISATTTSSASSSVSSSSSSSSASASSSSASGTCTALPEETNGPYPADGSNSYAGATVNVLTQSGVVRSDIRTSFGTYAGQATGVPLVLTITVEDSANGCQPLSGYAVYIWQCTDDGLYSLYSTGVTAQNYLRGVQVTDANGQCTFTTVFPGCYTGRMPHIHVEVYATLASAVHERNARLTTQFAFPTDVSQTVYNSVSSYSASIRAFNSISFASDNVFSDDTTAQRTARTIALTGNSSDGYRGTVTCAIA
ncbi:MAG: intradiol ring-cleavage dioxygenase [Asticcacaulis sp.]